MAAPSPRKQWSTNGATHPELDDKLAVQRSLQEAVEDIKVKLHSKDYFVKASVIDPPELIRQQALSSCNLPPFDCRDPWLIVLRDPPRAREVRNGRRRYAGPARAGGKRAPQLDDDS